MSSVAISGNASGAGVFTIAAPNSASSFTLTLPVQTGTLVSGANANSVTLPGATSGTMTLAAPAVAGTTTITMPAVTGTMVVLPTTVSMVQLYTGNGQGSTNTAIRRFTNTITNTGTDITYADSATLGSTFTINTNGIYAIAYGDSFNGAGQLGLSLNSTQLSTSIASITSTDRIAFSSTSAANINAMVSATLYLPASSVIRPHSVAGTANGATPALSTFLIVRVA